MGLSIKVTQKTDYCEHCGRYDEKELFYAGNYFLKESPTAMTKNAAGDTVIRRSFAPRKFQEVFNNCWNTVYTREQAVEKLKAVKGEIDEKQYRKIMNVLKAEGDITVFVSY